MSVLRMGRGPSASGKSTYFNQFLGPMGNWIRVGKDFLRTMLLNDAWSPKKERFVRAAEQAIVAALGKDKMNIFVDDTNLRPEDETFWSGFAEANGMKFDVKDFNTDFDICLERDQKRYGKARVGRFVIEHQFLLGKYIEWDVPIVLVDLDGTVADCEHRLPLIQKKICEPCHGTGLLADSATCGTCNGKGKQATDHSGFWDLTILDTPIDRTIEEIRNLSVDHMICIVSGRHMKQQGKDTLAWMELNRVPFDHIFLRRDGDHRKPFETKSEIVDKILAQVPAGLVKCAFDDDPLMINAYLQRGIPTYECGPNGPAEEPLTVPAELPEVRVM